MDTLEKSVVFRLIKNSIGSFEWSKHDIIENLDLLEREVNNKEEIKLKNEILEFKKILEKNEEFEGNNSTLALDSMIDLIKAGNLKIINLIKFKYDSLKKENSIIKLEKFKGKIKQLENSILAALIVEPKNIYLIKVAKQLSKL